MLDASVDFAEARTRLARRNATMIEHVVKTLRVWFRLVADRPHDAMAMAVLSTIGMYFSIVVCLLILSGPGE